MMTMRFSLAALVAALVLTAIAPVQAQDQQLERVVLLSRHGVRAPTDPPEVLNKLSASPWPQWPVAPGELTARGAELMVLMGNYYREDYSGRGLLSPERCPRAGTIQGIADVDQRTRVSGQALLDGLYPQCRLVVQYQADLAKPDPLFHTVKAGMCSLDEGRVQRSILNRVGGDLRATLDMYSTQFGALQNVLCPSGMPGSTDACGIWRQPLHVGVRDGKVGIYGPLHTASTVTEAFELESAQGMPNDQVAWGRLRGDAKLSELMLLHTLELDLAQRTTYVARRTGSSLLATILSRLENNDAPRLTFLVGHDTNIANVSGMLGLHWVIPGFAPDDPVPGGALAFELLRNTATGESHVRLAYYAQTLEQMRTLTRPNFNRPVAKSEIQLPACAEFGPGGGCPWPRFREIARAAIDPECAGGAR